MKFEHTSGGFTLPGESGQEKLTLELAKKWGADVIRDSDGTQLSDFAGYPLLYGRHSGGRAAPHFDAESVRCR